MVTPVGSFLSPFLLVRLKRLTVLQKREALDDEAECPGLIRSSNTLFQHLVCQNE
jgi:hypothetical protein